MLEALLFADNTLSESTKNVEILERARKAIVRYALKIIPRRLEKKPSKYLREQVAEFSDRVKDAVFAIKEVIDHTEYFLTRLWRAFHEVVRYYIKVDVACNRHEVFKDDIFLAMDILDPEDLDEVSRSSIEIERLPSYDIEDIEKELRVHCNHLLNRKIGSPRFIANNDPGFDIEDIRRLLMAEGLRLVLRYEHFRNTIKIKNYAKRGMTNKCTNFIKANTAKCRGAISSVEGDSGREFIVRKVSIDSPVGGDEDEGDRSLGDVYKDEDPRVRPDVIYEQKELIEALLTRSPSSVKRFVSIITGNGFGRPFRQWLSYRHGVAVEDLKQDDYFTLGEYALEFLGVSRAKVVRHVVPYLVQ